MADLNRPRVAREDVVPDVGRRLVVRCERIGCDHAALFDPRPLFGATGWPREGRSNRFRCVCGCRDSQVTYTSNTVLRDGPIDQATLALWV
jgi:hypothetical protein